MSSVEHAREMYDADSTVHGTVTLKPGVNLNSVARKASSKVNMQKSHNIHNVIFKLIGTKPDEIIKAGYSMSF